MDYISHGLWGRLLFGRGGGKYTWVKAFLAGLIADTVSFVPWLLLGMDPRTTAFWTDKNVAVTYGLGHSYVTVAAVFALTYILQKRVPVWLWAWPFAITLDWPLHEAWIGTPIFWPISDWKFDGISWTDPRVLGLNLIALIIGFSLLYWYKRRAKG